MKILIMVHSLRGGGAERVAANLANSWFKAGHAVSLTVMTPLSDIEFKTDEGIALQSLAELPRSGFGKPGEVFARLKAIRDHIEAVNPDIVVAIQANMAIEVALSNPRCKAKLIGAEHNNPDYAVRGKLWQALRPLAYRHLDAVTTLTTGAAKSLKAVCPKTEIIVIPNAVEWPLRDHAPQIEPSSVLGSDRRIIFAAGRLVPAKGFDDLITAFARIANALPEHDLVIAGEGPLRSDLAAQISASGLTDRIHLPGRIGNMAQWYSRSDLFVMSSRHEGLPMVMLEALASGVPVISYDFDYGPRDLIRDGIDGRIVPKGDVAALGDAITAVASDPEARQSFSDAAKTIHDRFGEPAILKLWAALFDRLV